MKKNLNWWIKLKKIFEKSMMISGGIYFYDLSHLLLEGTMNEFIYAQTFYFYKENFEELKKNIIQKIFLNKLGQPLIQVLIIQNL